ncbi:hypothetical protein MUY35_13085 [Aliiroseovarius sp. S1339]|uniref:hypothetical protein n=1 Tax=Aliiroseovarius sp. S1339 TaxID=2936990 RepID=UPI0020C127F4|nr:hypothetical protein [Aliiroseovarius sp. S1339]MCK8464785.1 hypothetical protein [Aliiroseovarius sp. S1339]
MKNSIIALVIVGAAAIGGYIWYSNSQADMVSEDAVPEAAADVNAAETAAGEAAAAAEAEAKAAADAAAEEAAAAAEAAGETLNQAGEAVTDAVEGAVESATDAVEGAVESATDAVEGAVESATDAVEGATEAPAAEASDEAAMDALTTDGFDAAKVNEMIDGSSLGDAEKAGLKAAVDAAAQNPALLEAAINQVKSALGM